MKSSITRAFCSPKSFAIVAVAFLFATSVVVCTAQARSFDKPQYGRFQSGGFIELCNRDSPISEDTIINEGGIFEDGNCVIEVAGSRLVFNRVRVKVTNGDLRIYDIPCGDGENASNTCEVSELVVKNSHILTSEKVRIEGSWDGGVTCKNNWIRTEDDLRIQPVGSGNLIFEDSRGHIGGDIRLGDVIQEKDENSNDTIVGGLDGYIEVRDNRIIFTAKQEGPIIRAQSNTGDIRFKYNIFGHKLEGVEIESEEGHISFLYNIFGREFLRAIGIVSHMGTVYADYNRFGSNKSK